MIGQPKSQIKLEVRTLGLDLSLSGTGICYLENNEFDAIFLPETKLVGVERLLVLRQRFCEILDAHPLPALAVIEGYAYDAIGRLFEIGEWGGIAKLALHERGIPFVTVPPNRLKRFMGVKRKDKELMIKAVKTRLKSPTSWMVPFLMGAISTATGTFPRLRLLPFLEAEAFW